MKIDKSLIEAYIPQRAPFIMVDNLIEATAERFETDFRVLPDNIFLEGNTLREFALIENIAQSCAAGIAFLNRSIEHEPKDGLMGGLAKLKVHQLPKANDLIFTQITVLHQLGNMYLCKGENYVGNDIYLECEIKLVGL